MIEKIIKDYLSETLSVPVLLEKPSPPPASYCIIEKTGGGREDTLHHTMLNVESHAPTLWETAQLHEAAMAAMLQADTLPEVSKVSLNTEYNNTDTETKSYQYEAVYEVTHFFE